MMMLETLKAAARSLRHQVEERQHELDKVEEEIDELIDSEVKE